MKYSLGALSLAALLAACSTSEHQTASARNTCFAYGLSPGSPGYADCVMSERQAFAAEQHKMATLLGETITAISEDYFAADETQ